MLTPEFLFGMQRMTGNATVGRMLAARGATIQRRDENSEPAEKTSADSERKKIEDALKPDADAGDVKEITDFSQAQPDELVKLAHTLVYKYSLFFGPNDRSTLVKIYQAMGKDIKTLVLKDPFMFQKCLEEWPGTMEQIQPVKEAGRQVQGRHLRSWKEEPRRQHRVPEGRADPDHGQGGRDS